MISVHKVSSFLKSRQNTHNSVKYEVIWIKWHFVMRLIHKEHCISEHKCWSRHGFTSTSSSKVRAMSDKTRLIPRNHVPKKVRFGIKDTKAMVDHAFIHRSFSCELYSGRVKIVVNNSFINISFVFLNHQVPYLDLAFKQNKFWGKKNLILPWDITRRLTVSTFLIISAAFLYVPQYVYLKL